MTINDGSVNGYSRPVREEPLNGDTLRLGQRSNRPIRIAGCSGGVYDRKRAIHDMAKNEDVDVITGDWMSECNMTLRGSDKRDRMAAANMASGSSVAKGYEPYFLEELDPAIPWLAQRGVKLCANAGASDVQGLVAAVQELIRKHGVDLKVAWVDGDDVTDVVLDLYKNGEQFPNLPANKNIKDWGFDPVCAQCYLGSTGIAECFKAGADIVLCGRVSDASPTIGAAMWWYDWNREEHLQELASALMVGHIIECSTYATGGYYSGFKELGVSDTDMGYPIAILESNGEVTITMEKGKHGLVNVATIASQLLYEIQGPLYFNSDVVANIEDVKLEQVGKNVVRFSGVKGLPAPSTTKVGITAKGGYQAEFHFYLTGLNIPEKAAMVERQTKALMGDHLEKFSCLKFMVAGTAPSDPQSQEEATVDMRIFAQTRDPDILSGNAFVDSDRGSFARFCIENLLQGYPGSTMAPDMRTAIGRPFFEYWVALMPQKFVQETAHLPNGQVVDISHPKNTMDYPREQK